MAKKKTFKVYFSNKETGYTTYTFISMRPSKHHWKHTLMHEYYKVKDLFFNTHNKEKYIINDIEPQTKLKHHEKK